MVQVSGVLLKLSKMINFTIARHGETINNVAQIVQSRTDGELTERGARMAQHLGRSLEGETFSKIFSSDLGRCRETTENIISNLKTVVPPVHYTEFLRERDYGDWEFQSHQVVTDAMTTSGLPPWKRYQVEIPNGETFQDCKERAGKFFSQNILNLLMDDDDVGNQDGDSKNILAVSHGTYIYCLFEYWMDNMAVFELVNFNEKQIWRRAPNTCITRCTITKIGDNNVIKSNDSSMAKGQPRFRLEFSHIFDAEHLRPMEDYEFPEDSKK